MRAPKFSPLALPAIAALVLSVLGAENANAIPVTCPAAWTQDGPSAVVSYPTQQTAASACFGDTTIANDNNNGAALNTAAVFGFSDWAPIIGSFQIVGGAKVGTWSITAPDFLNKDYMMILKGPANSGPAALYAFLLNEEASSGSWQTVWFNSQNRGQNISHFSLFSRDNPYVCTLDCGPPTTEVPEPGTLALFGTGLAALGVMRRRRKRV